jgi:ACR3 family arsenite efflux pump ArsB
MYAFKNPVYLAIGVALVLFGAAFIAKSYPVVGAFVLVLGLVMATFAAYQMGQASPVPKA